MERREIFALLKNHVYELPSNPTLSAILAFTRFLYLSAKRPLSNDMYGKVHLTAFTHYRVRCGDIIIILV